MSLILPVFSVLLQKISYVCLYDKSEESFCIFSLYRKSNFGTSLCESKSHPPKKYQFHPRGCWSIKIEKILMLKSTNIFFDSQQIAFLEDVEFSFWEVWDVPLFEGMCGILYLIMSWPQKKITQNCNGYFKINFQRQDFDSVKGPCTYFRERRTSHKICSGALCIMARDKILMEQVSGFFLTSS